MNAEYLAQWVKTADVRFYQSGSKEVYVAGNNLNQYLILTCERVLYRQHDKRYPHVVLVWVDNGVSELLYQTIVDERYREETHSMGNIAGDFGPSENLETVWNALYMNSQITLP